MLEDFRGSGCPEWDCYQNRYPSPASAAHHDDDATDSFTWNHQDAEAILAAAVHGKQL